MRLATVAWESKFLKQNDYKTPEDPGKWAFKGFFASKMEYHNLSHINVSSRGVCFCCLMSGGNIG